MLYNYESIVLSSHSKGDTLYKLPNRALMPNL